MSSLASYFSLYDSKLNFMKAILTTAFISCISLMVQAQQLSNGGFEVWDTTPQGTEPNAWASNNFMLGPNGGTPLVTQSTDAHSGSYAVQMKTDSITDPMTQQLTISPGFIFTGSAPTGPGTFPVNGIPYNQHIDSLVAFYKYTPVGNDMMTAMLVLTKWNTQNNMRDTLGKSTMAWGASNGYAKLLMPFQYFQEGAVSDSLFITFASSDRNTAQKGSTLILDDVMLFANQTGIEVLHGYTNAIKAYPIPVKNTLHLSGSEYFKIYNSHGVLVKSVNVGRTRAIELDITDLAAGEYFIKTPDGQSKKFIK